MLIVNGPPDRGSRRWHGYSPASRDAACICPRMSSGTSSLDMCHQGSRRPRSRTKVHHRPGFCVGRLRPRRLRGLRRRLRATGVPGDLLGDVRTPTPGPRRVDANLETAVQRACARGDSDPTVLLTSDELAAPEMIAEQVERRYALFADTPNTLATDGLTTEQTAAAIRAYVHLGRARVDPA